MAKFPYRYLPVLVLAGCVSVKPFGTATLLLKPEVGYKSQTIINPYVQADISHLTIKVFNTSEQDLGISKDLLNAQLDNPIVFSNLKNNTTYRIRPFAYASTGTSQCISSSSYVDVVVGTDDRPAIATLSVQLIDKAFNGQASSSLVVNSGGYVAIASESLETAKVVTTLAGNGNNSDVNGLGTAASFAGPTGITVDSAGYIYVADDGQRIRKVSPAGYVITLAGNGSTTFADGAAAVATFNAPRGIVVDPSGTVYVTDANNNRIRKVTSDGTVSTFAGNGGTAFANGNGTSATIVGAQGIAIDASGNLYVAETGGNRIRKITSGGVVTTLAGNGVTGCANGSGTAAAFHFPGGVTVGDSGNLYVADTYNNRICRITPAGVVTTLAGNGGTAFADGTGTAATFDTPYGITYDPQGYLYVADWNHNRIRRVSLSGVVTTVAGSGSISFGDGTGTSAGFYFPYGIASDAYGKLYVTDYLNRRVRVLQ